MVSFQTLRKYNLTPSNVHASLVNEFKLKQLKSVDALDHYCLLYWNPEYFYTQMIDGVVIKNDIRYLVIYHKCTPTEVRKRNQIALSFRAAKAEFNLPAYVLVSKGDH